MRKIKKMVFITAAVALVYYASLITLGMRVHPETSDMAVVLGNEVLTSGKPSQRLQARLDCAIALYKAQAAPLIMASGGVGASGFDEATTMAEYLISKGIPKENIIVDSQGVNTMATARNAAQLMKKRHMKNAIIVTQYFHIPRTELAFHMAGINNFTADYPLFFEWRDIPSTLREMIAVPFYLLTKERSNN